MSNMREKVFESIRQFSVEHQMDHNEALELFYEVMNETTPGKEVEEKKLIEISLEILSSIKKLQNIVLENNNISILRKVEITDKIMDLEKNLEKRSQLDVISQIVDLEEKLIGLLGR